MQVGRGSMWVGGGCIEARQELWWSEMRFSADFASSKFLRYQHTYLPRDTPSYRVAKQRLKTMNQILAGMSGLQWEKLAGSTVKIWALGPRARSIIGTGSMVSLYRVLLYTVSLYIVLLYAFFLYTTATILTTMMMMMLMTKMMTTTMMMTMMTTKVTKKTMMTTMTMTTWRRWWLWRRRQWWWWRRWWQISRYWWMHNRPT